MAAAEYYNPGAPPQQQQPAPRPAIRPPARRPSGPMSQQTLSPLPYPVSDAPPPYSQLSDQRPHSQPPLSSRASTNYGPPSPGRPGPLPQQQNGGYLPDKTGYRPSPMAQPQNMYTPNGLNPSQAQYPPPPQQGYPFPASGQPAMGQVYGPGVDPRRPSTTPGYGPSQSPYLYEDDYDNDNKRSRSRSRHGKHHHHHHHHDALSTDRSMQGKKNKPSGVGTVSQS